MQNLKKLCKIVIIGDSGYVSGKFDKYKNTIGADFMTKDVKVEDRMVTLQIWDTAGQERFQSLGAAFYRGADGCVLVYDITLPKIWDTSGESIGALCRRTDCCVLVYDITSPKISEDQAQEWCKKYENIQYFETSADYGKENEKNLELVFDKIVKAAKEKIEKMYFYIKKN